MAVEWLCTGSVKIRLMNSKNTLIQLFQAADIKFDGNRPWDPQIHNDDFYHKVLAQGSLGLGESYMQGDWDCDEIDTFVSKAVRLDLRKQITNSASNLKAVAVAHLLNLQSQSRSKKVAREHYDLSNTVYQNMLGKTMAYTCGYWKEVTTLDEAQYAKYDLICRKLNLQAEDKVLEMGCGWGGFAHYANKHYGCHVTAVNISERQVQYATEHYGSETVQFHLCDYRNSQSYNPNRQLFDKVVSIGMCEHVGVKNYKNWFNIIRDQLKDDGLFLLHTISSDEYITKGEPWLDKYIFAGGVLPSPKSLGSAIDGQFVIEDWHDFGVYYDTTLMAWFANFDAYWQKKEQPTDLHLQNMDRETFYRMWQYYLLSMAGVFRARYASLWQIVLSKSGLLGGYTSIR